MGGLRRRPPRRLPGLLPACGALLLALAAASQALAERKSLYAALADGDRALAGEAVQTALETLPSRQTRSWRNPQTGASGFVTPLRTFKIESGHFCREYQEAISTPTAAEARQFTACRQPEDGRWILVGSGG